MKLRLRLRHGYAMIAAPLGGVPAMPTKQVPTTYHAHKLEVGSC